jgi:NAD(P)-dependent dehydrogenase (short-subunit alcohol dehydrogenase family)
LRITTPFGFHTTAADVIAGIDLTGRRVVITGATSGIGIETARALASAGADVTLAVRRLDAGTRIAGEIARATGNRKVRARPLDLAEAASIEAFVAGWQDPLDVLIANAGIMAPPERHTREGWDAQFAINHLAHFALAIGLHGAMRAAGRARIVSLSSSSHQIAPIAFDDIHFVRRPYDPIAAYGQSKTANALFAVGAWRRWAADGIMANALMPGAIPTNLQRFVGGMRTEFALRKTIEEGAATSVFVAASPILEGIGGRYFADCQEAPLVEGDQRDMSKVAPHALDPALADRLWEASLGLYSQRHALPRP